MIGISFKLQLTEIVQYLDKQFKGQFNFINCPPHKAIYGDNLGYFVINFKNTEKIYRFTKDFLHGKLFPSDSDDDDSRRWRTVQFCTLQRMECNTKNVLDCLEAAPMSMRGEKKRLVEVVTSQSLVFKQSGMTEVRSVARERIEESVATGVERSHEKEEEKEKEKEKGIGKRKGRERKEEMEEGNDNEDNMRRDVSTVEESQVMDKDEKKKKKKKVEIRNRKESSSKSEETNACSSGCGQSFLPLPLPLLPLDPLYSSQSVILDDMITGHSLHSQKSNKKKKNNNNNNNINNESNSNNYNRDKNSNINKINNNNSYSIKNDKHKNLSKEREGILKNSAEQSKEGQQEKRKESHLNSSQPSTPHPNTVINKHITFDSEDESEVRHNINTTNNSATRGEREGGEEAERVKESHEGRAVVAVGAEKLKTRMKKRRKKGTGDEVVYEEIAGVGNDDVILSRNGKNMKKRKFTKMDEIPCVKSVKTRRKERDKGDEEDEGKEENNKKESEREEDCVVDWKNRNGEREGKRKGRGQMGGLGEGMEGKKQGSPMSFKSKKNRTLIALSREPAVAAVTAAVIIIARAAAAVPVRAVAAQEVDDDEGIIRHTSGHATRKLPKKTKGQASIINYNNHKKQNDNNKKNSSNNYNNKHKDDIFHNNNNNINNGKNIKKKNEGTEGATDIVTKNAESKKKQNLYVTNTMKKGKNRDEEVVNHGDKNRKGIKGSVPVFTNLLGTVYAGTLKRFKMIGDDNADSTVSGINWGLDDGAQALRYE